jgi:hypothetical protein
MPTQISPRVVFLDANVIVGKGWDHPLLQRFMDLVYAGLVLPVTTDLTKTEIAKVLAEKDFGSISQFTQPRARRLAEQLFGLPVPEIDAVALRERLLGIHLARTRQFFEEIGAIESEVDSVKPSVVMAAYANRTGVFAEGAKKQQFNDAFILEALRPLANQDGLVIVSADSDFHVAVKDEPHFRALKGLPELFSELGLKSDRTADVRAFLKRRAMTVVAVFDNLLHSTGIRIGDVPASEVLRFQVTRVDFPFLQSFRTASGEGLFVTAGVAMTTTVDYAYPDWENEEAIQPGSQWLTIANATKEIVISAPCTLILRTDKAGEPLELSTAYFDDDSFTVVKMGH